jgi:transketolase
MSQTLTSPTFGTGFDDVARLAAQLRVDSLRATEAAQSGHATSSLSAADLMAVLLARHLVYDWHAPNDRDNDHLIFSKGHASPLLYAMFKAAGVIDDDELVRTYRQFGSRLQGHPTPVLPWVDVATGSLGQGLPIGVGLAWVADRLEQRDTHVWVLCGDGEFAEGSIWEALETAGGKRLANVTAIVDVNRLGQSGSTELEWDLDAYARRVRGFVVDAVVVDGHDLPAIDAAMAAARTSDRPTAILARTIKGKGVPEVEDLNGWHGKALPSEMADSAIARLGGVTAGVVPRHPAAHRPARTDADRAAAGGVPRPPIPLPQYERGSEVATRSAFGDALHALAAVEQVAVVDGDVGNSTHAGAFTQVAPDRFFECGIAEQQLISTAVALSVRGFVPYAATFAAFLSRAYDFIRMAAISRADLRLCGSHAGVEIGEDGPSQMALEDIAALRAILGSTVLYPSDAPSAAALTVAMLDVHGISYLRTTRGAYPVLYGPDETFPIGGSKTLRDGEDVALVGAGVTVHTCLAAADRLAEQGVRARVVDVYSIKPVDRDGLMAAAEGSGRRLVVVEDHHREGGVGSAVLEALADAPTVPRVRQLAVRGLPGSGTAQQLMDAAGIGVDDVVRAAADMVAAA